LAVDVIKFALLVTMAWTEIAWWEGEWADLGVACDALSGDRPMVLSPILLDLGETECVDIKEQRSDHLRLRLNAVCREHGDATPRARSFVLEPSDGGKAMTMSDGDGLWHLRKCR
jgi:hypothetical protein